MNAAQVARFDAQAAETVGAMKELFQEFERALGEVVAAQRVASSQAQEAGVKARLALEAIARQGQSLAEAQGAALAELRRSWQWHVAENSRAAGAEMARAFGEEISVGLRQRLEKLGDALERVTQRFERTSTVKWAAAIGAGIAMTILLGVSMLSPSVPGLSDERVRAASLQLVPCPVTSQVHVCIRVDSTLAPPNTADGEVLAVVRGM